MAGSAPESGFWNVCFHPAEQQMECPTRAGHMICGKCGHNYQAVLDEQLLDEQFQRIAQHGGYLVWRWRGWGK